MDDPDFYTLLDALAEPPMENLDGSGVTNLCQISHATALQNTPAEALTDTIPSPRSASPPKVLGGVF